MKTFGLNGNIVYAASDKDTRVLISP